ncbi:patatin-like phospholipase family protein [Georgenia satyanarayanai]|uniref:patatin-like phospholipase family protein n=1 Tax=Georgenia satyanarayanai TaxID=860221 RepID=UPI001264F925|nr:patatin-like phospholipase family protein [Georgenia satyanarayanai]
MDRPTDPPRRSLVLAGGGTKVAFQAGVLQVWLDEAGLEFDHADGASGGVFNLAMWAQGMTGRQIADNWRRYSPLGAVEPNLRGLLRGPFAPSVLRLERFRRNVLGAWGLDWTAIRATPREATFNLYDFSAHELVIAEAAEMDEDRLLSAVSLPMWFPPVPIDGHTYIDAVFATDANLEEAARRGADELWVIWTVSRRGTWRPGLVPQYFQVIEAAANSRLRSELDRIERSNAAWAATGGGEFGRHIEVKLLQAEVPVHYLFTFRRDRMRMAVELGVAAGRRWCAEQGIPTHPAGDPLPRPSGAGIRFTEVMAGFAAWGARDPLEGAVTGAQEQERLRFRLTIVVRDLDRFVASPEHEALARGWVEYSPLGGRFPVESGTFNLFVDQSDPARKRMLYRLHFTDSGGFPLTLLGHKVVEDDPGPDFWADTTTLYTRLLRGHVDWDDAEEAETVAAGILRITPPALARQLTTFRARGDTAVQRWAALARFGRLFLGQVWDVYVSPADAPRGL